MPEIIVKLGDSFVHRYAFDKDVVSIGRARDNDIVLETLSISRNHARIRHEEGRYILTDLQSANGTYVNGVKVNKAEVMDGDVITIGKHQLYFQAHTMGDEQSIGDAFGADRTMMVAMDPIAVLTVAKGKQQNQEFTIDQYETWIGRSEDCQVQLHDWFVGKKHAVIHRERGAFTIRDTGKLAGVHVNDQPVREPRLLQDGDIIKISNAVLSFKILPAGQSSAMIGRKPVEIGYDDEGDFDSRVDKEFESMQAMSSRLSEVEDAPAAALEEGETELFSPMLDETAGENDDSAAEGITGEDIVRAGAGSSPMDDYDDVSEAAAIDEPAAVAESREAEAALAEHDHVFDESEVELGDVSPDEILPVAPPEADMISASQPADERPESRAEAEEEKGGAGSEAPPPTPGAGPSEIAMWERALKNSSPLIRAEAARMLRRLTGKDYDA